MLLGPAPRDTAEPWLLANLKHAQLKGMNYRRERLTLSGHSTSSYLGLVVATCADSSLAPALPFVARLELLLFLVSPPPGPGPLVPVSLLRRSRHLRIKLLARPASSLSLVFFRLNSLICFPSLVTCTGQVSSI